MKSRKGRKKDEEWSLKRRESGVLYLAKEEDTGAENIEWVPVEDVDPELLEREKSAHMNVADNHSFTTIQSLANWIENPWEDLDKT